MEQFSLEKWLKNKSRKVVTRDGREVEILKTNRKDGIHPIIFTILDQNGVEQVHFCNKVGICTTLPSPNKFDLFFADEEELTEFEKELQIIISEASHWTSDDGSISTYCQFGDKEIKKISGQLLDLARKELEANYYTKVIDDRMVFKSELHEQSLQTAYDMGKQDVLKDLPKWKNVLNDKDFYLHEKLEDYFVKDTLHPNGCVKERWVLKKSDLDKLPKEE